MNARVYIYSGLILSPVIKYVVYGEVHAYQEACKDSWQYMATPTNTVSLLAFSASTSDALKMWLVHVLAVCTVVAIIGGSKFTLNVPQVLLPLVPSSGVRANFTLTAKQGCFIW